MRKIDVQEQQILAGEPMRKVVGHKGKPYRVRPLLREQERQRMIEEGRVLQRDMVVRGNIAHEKAKAAYDAFWNKVGK